LGAHAQTAPEAPVTSALGNAAEKSVLDDTYITVGVGGLYGPSYEGSNNMTASAVPLIQGSVRGVSISPRPSGVALDFIPDGHDAKIGFILGPVAGYSRNRAHNIKDPVVIAAGRLKSAIDVGVTAGVVGYKLLNPYDSLTLSADVKWNVNSASKGMTVIPSLTYTTPVSRAMLVSLGVNAKHVDSDYADYYYDVSASQSLASGLPVYSARGGWATVGATLLAAYDLDGNLLNGGFALIGLASYNKLLNDAKNTPYTSLRGSDNQWTVGGGVAYTF
jgi:outer membrane scaffolding protein for murein synthesis (MipA/OmpV family)